MGNSMKAATPPPDEMMVRDALLRVIGERGLQAREDEVSIRLVNAPWPRQRTYTVIIAYRLAARALTGVLRRSASSVEKESVEVWVLSESEARQLCASQSIDASHPDG